MVLYGGSLINSISTLQGDVYILDIATLTWTKGPVPSSSQLRRNMACTVAGSNFVVWGGQSLNGEFMNMAVFDLRTNEWTTQFVLDTPPSPPSSSPTASPVIPMQVTTNADNSTQRPEHGRITPIIVGISTSATILIAAGCIWFCIRKRKAQGKPQWSRINNVNVNNKPKRSSKRWSGRGQGPAGDNNSRDPQETNSLQHQIFEQERRSQEKNSVSRSNSEKSVSDQLLSPTMTDHSDTIVALSSRGSIGGVVQSQEDWLKRQREEVDQERQALAIMQMQQLEYARQVEALKTEVFIQRQG
ncbi:hypothetical protein BGX24_008673 [Mortierella sp. AD032]|nr:hypothetical protein BGX24_008673 [Mortierella sp. AD032]